MENKKAGAAGFLCGILNGFFGSGGGMVAVPAFQKSGLSVKEAHGTSVFTMAALSALSVGLAFGKGQLSFGDALPFLPGGLLGSVLAARFFGKIPAGFLRKLLGALSVFAALRLLGGGVR